MATFNLDEFLANPTFSQFDYCRKKDVCVSAEFDSIPVLSVLLSVIVLPSSSLK